MRENFPHFIDKKDLWIFRTDASLPAIYSAEKKSSAVSP